MVGHARKTAESLHVLVFKTGQDLFVKVSLKIPSPNKLKYVQPVFGADSTIIIHEKLSSLPGRKIKMRSLACLKARLRHSMRSPRGL